MAYLKKSKTVFLYMLPLLMLLAVTGCSVNQTINNTTATWSSNAPKVVRTSPESGNVNVDPATDELRITFDKEMEEGGYSLVKDLSKGQFPETIGTPVLSSDRKTFVQKIRLQPKTNYYISINSNDFSNFKDTEGTPAIPYLLEFETR